MQEITLDLVEGLAERGYQAKAIALYPHSSTPEEEVWTHICQCRPSRLFELLGVVKALIVMLDRHSPDVIFTAMPAANVLVALAVAVSGRRINVNICHHSPVNTYNKGLNLIDGFIGSTRIVRNVICVSRAVAESLAQKPARYRNKARVIKNALSPRIGKVIANLSLSQSDGKGFDVAVVGRLSPEKNADLIIRAAVLLPEVIFHFVGDGPERAALEDLSKNLGVWPRTKFWGAKSRPEALSILFRCKVFVQPSKFEGNSVALMEAAHLGLPLVVSDAPSQRESVTDSDGTVCGSIVKVDDPQALAKSIECLLKDPELYSRHANLSRKLSASNSFSCFVDQYEQVASSESF